MLVNADINLLEMYCCHSDEMTLAGWQVVESISPFSKFVFEQRNFGVGGEVGKLIRFNRDNSRWRLGT